MQWLEDLDWWLLFKINRDWSNSLFDLVMPIVTDLHKAKLPFAIGIIALLIFLTWKRSKKERVQILSTLFIGVLVTDLFCGQVLKNLVERKRPSLQNADVILRVPIYGNRSFPSNHAANMFCLAMIISLFYPRLAKYVFPLALLIAYSRSYVGLHFPSDWIAGAIIGAGIGFITFDLMKRWAKRWSL